MSPLTRQRGTPGLASILLHPDPEPTVVPQLAELFAAGVPLIACRTCLDFYSLQDSVVVGEIGNMLRIVEAQASASKVITL